MRRLALQDMVQARAQAAREWRDAERAQYAAALHRLSNAAGAIPDPAGLGRGVRRVT